MSKPAPDHRLDGVIRIAVLVLIVSVPLVFIKALHDGFNVPKQALAEFLVFEMVLLWLLRMNRRQAFTFLRSPFYLPLALFLGIEILSMLWAENVHLSLELLPQDVATALFIVLLVHFVRGEVYLRRIVAAAIGAASLVALLGYVQYFGLDPLSLFAGAEYRWGQIIMGSTIGHYNYLAAYLNTVIPLCTAMVVTGSGPKRRLMYGALLALLFLTLLLTRSRGAWLGWITASLVFWGGLLVRQRHREHRLCSEACPRLVLTAIAVVLVVSLALHVGAGIAVNREGTTLRAVTQRFASSTAQRAVSSFYINTGSAMHRRIIWIPTLRMIADHPLLGVGKNNFQIIYPKYTPERHKETLNILTHRGTKVHSEYLQIFAELGLIGLLAFLLLIAVVFRTSLSLLRHERQDRDSYVLDLALAAGLVAPLVQAVVDNPLRLPASAFSFALLVGLIGARQARLAPSYSRPIRPGRGARQALTVVLILLMLLVPVLLLRPVIADYYIKKGNTYKDHQRPDEALAFYQVACSYGNRDSEVYRNIGRLQYQKKNYEAAGEAWQTDLKLNPHFPLVYYYLGSLSVLQGNLNLAEERLHQALERYPGYTEVRERLDHLYRSWGAQLEEHRQYGVAADVYGRALRLFDTVFYHLRRGHVLYRAGMAQEAIVEFEAVLDLEPDHWEANRALGYIYSRSSEPQLAVPYLERCRAMARDRGQRRSAEEELQRVREGPSSGP